MKKKSQLESMTLVRSFILRQAEPISDDLVLAEFYRWQAESLREIKVSTKSPRDRIVKAAVAKMEKPIRPARCFDNALWLAHADPKIKYVEGYHLQIFENGMRMLYSHAWNSVDGQHFDLTAEANQSAYAKAGVKRHFKSFYFQIIELDAATAFGFFLNTEKELHILHFCKLRGLPSGALSRGWNIVENKAVI